MIKETKMKRSDTYQFTVDSPTDERIKNIRRWVKFDNLFLTYKNADHRFRVKVRPRLGRNNPNAHLYAVGGHLHRFSSQDIRPEHGTRFDIYLYKQYVSNV